MTRLLPGFLILIVLLPALAGPAAACICLYDDHKQGYIDRQALIFEGVAESSRVVRGSSRYSRATRFRITKLWKGRPRRSVRIWHRAGGCGRGIDFEPGKTYRVFARRDRGRLTTDPCAAPRERWPDYKALLTRKGP